MREGKAGDQEEGEQWDLQASKGVEKGGARGKETGKQESPGLAIDFRTGGGKLYRGGLLELPPSLEAEQSEAPGTGNLGEGTARGELSTEPLSDQGC